MQANPTDVHPESGFVGVGTVIGLGIAALFVYLLLAAVEGDSDHFGRVPVPSTALVELPEGETELYFFQGIGSGPDMPLVPPADLSYSIASADGAAVSVDARSDDPEAADGGAAQLVGAVFPPADGTYTVRVVSNDAAQLIDPELTFGQSPVQAVTDRFESVVEELKGPTGIVVAVALVILFLVPTVQRALRARD